MRYRETGMLAWALLLVGCQTSVPLDATSSPRLPPLAASVPVDPGINASPYDASLEVPDLARRKSELDLETLGWHQTTYHVEVDLSALGRVPSSRDLMIRMAADPRWRVGVYDGAVVAFQREIEGTSWSVARHGFHEDKVGVWRTAVRFTPWGRGSLWGTDLVTSAPASQRRIDVRAFELLAGPAAGLEATALSIQAGALSLDVFEATDDRGRPRTSVALSQVPATLEGLVGSSWQRIAWDSGTDEKPHLDVRSPGAGMLSVKGRVAATSPGWTWVRILDAKGVAWEEAAVAIGTRQLVWGAPDEDRRSYVQSELPVPSGDAFSGTAEVWHTPVDGGATKRLAAYPVSVPAR